jgi:hypothetical protein
MKEIFAASLVLFVIVQLFIIYQLYKKKKKVGSHSTLISFILFCILLVAIYIFRINVPLYVLLLCIIVLLLNSIIGYYLEYFWKSITIDRYLHGFGIFSFTLLFYFVITDLAISGGAKLYQALFIAFLGISLGAIYEISEFRTDSKRNTRMQKGLKDTNVDIVFDVIGACAAAVFGYFIIL